MAASVPKDKRMIKVKQNGGFSAEDKKMIKVKQNGSCAKEKQMIKVKTKWRLQCRGQTDDHGKTKWQLQYRTTNRMI